MYGFHGKKQGEFMNMALTKKQIKQISFQYAYVENPQKQFMEEEYRKIMIKQKKEFEEYKKKEGDSDLIFNKKDNKENR